MAEYYGIDLSEVCLPELRALIAKWKESGVRLDEMLYEDASLTDFGESWVRTGGTVGGMLMIALALILTMRLLPMMW